MSSTGESEELIEALEASTSSSTESAQDVGSEATPTEGNEEERTKSLDKSKLCSIAAQLEAELEAFHFVLSSLKKDNLRKHKVLLQYGQLNATDPFSALHRDTQLLSSNNGNSKSNKSRSGGRNQDAINGAASDANTSKASNASASCQESCLRQATVVTHQPLLFVEELVKTHKRNLNRLGVQILHLERRYHKALTDLEEEKRKHGVDQAVGEEVAFHLEKERDKLGAKLEEEQGARKNMENNLLKIKQLLMNERSRRQSDTVKLLKDRQALVYKLYNEKKQAQSLKDDLAAEATKVAELTSAMEELSDKCRHFESLVNAQSSEESKSDFEKQQLELKLTRSEKQCFNLQEEIIRLKERIYELEKGKIPTSDIPEIVESRQPISQPAQQPRREYAPPPNMHSHGGAVVKLGAGSSSNSSTTSGISSGSLIGLSLSGSGSLSQSISTSLASMNSNPSQGHQRSPSLNNSTSNVSSSNSNNNNNNNPVQSPSAATPNTTLGSRLSPAATAAVSGLQSPPQSSSASTPGQYSSSSASAAVTGQHHLFSPTQSLTAKRNLNGRFPLDDSPTLNGPLNMSSGSVAGKLAGSSNQGGMSAAAPQLHQSLAAQFAASHSNPSLAISPTEHSLSMELLNLHGAINGLDSLSSSQDSVDFGSGDSATSFTGGVGGSLFMAKKGPTHSARNSNSLLLSQQHLAASSATTAASNSRISPPNSSEFNLFANTLPIMNSAAGGGGGSSQFSNRSTIPNASTNTLGMVPSQQSVGSGGLGFGPSSNHQSLSQISAALQQQTKQFQQHSTLTSTSYQNMIQPKYRINAGAPNASTTVAHNYLGKFAAHSTGVSASGVKPEPPARTSSSLSHHHHHQGIVGSNLGGTSAAAANHASTAATSQ